MNYDKLEFVGTVEELAAMHNLEVPYGSRQRTQPDRAPSTAELYQLLDGLNAFYQQSLMQPAADPAAPVPGETGVKQRGDCALFAIGYAPQVGITF